MDYLDEAEANKKSETSSESSSDQEEVDYIKDYIESDQETQVPKPQDGYKYEFESGNQMAETQQNSSSNENEATVVNGDENQPRTHQIFLYVKAGSDRECIGCCPFSQRLFMMLWLKGVVFNVTTVDKATKPKQLKDIAAGANPPFLLFNGEELTDVQKCEDYIEAELYPPRYPKLACRHPTSNTVGMDIFAKFSGLIKFTGQKTDPKRKVLEQKLIDALKKLNKYLEEPLDDEIDADDDDEEPQISNRRFIDGDNMTIADCNLLPKLNIIRVAGRERINFEIPEEFSGIHRYLKNADETEEFSQTCPADGEIAWTYGGRKPRPQGWK